MIYRTDYHIHSTFSDGRAAPEDYIEPARSAGLKEIGFSEHVTLFLEPQKWNMDPQRTGEYLSYISDLRAKSGGLIIRTGLEVDYHEEHEVQTAEFLKSLPLDYVIGSIHYQGETTVDSGPDFYESRNVDTLYETYFNTVCKAAESGLFDIIAHCDLIRIHGYRPSFDPEPLYRMLARTMKQNGVAFEVNTNGRNRPVADFYPDRRYLHVFMEEGVPVCVNSDAHFPHRVAQYFEEAYDLVRKAGFGEMAVFEGRKRRMMSFS